MGPWDVSTANMPDDSNSLSNLLPNSYDGISEEADEVITAKRERNMWQFLFSIIKGA